MLATTEGFDSGTAPMSGHAGRAETRDGGHAIVSREPHVRLSVNRLTLSRFRNYGSCRLVVEGGAPVLLTGPNGAGKTNLLEAVSLLSPGRGLRGAALADLEWKEPGLSDAGLAGAGAEGSGWAVAAHVTTGEDVIEIGTGLDADAAADVSGPPDRRADRRLVRINGETVRSQAALADHVAMVWLTPQMDRLFLDGASVRRRFLDRLVFGFDPAHAGRAARYERLMRERARLLRDRAADGAWLSALEGQMAETGIAIAAARVDVAQRLDAAAARAVGGFPRAAVRLDGWIDARLAENPAAEAEERFQRALAETREHDAVAGGARHGPHRSDMVVWHRDRGMPADQCSTGEQKALLIGLVLANARLMTAERGFAPILLLDEVVAHLDEARRAALFEQIGAMGAQAWLTGTDTGLFRDIGTDWLHVAVDGGRLQPGWSGG